MLNRRDMCKLGGAGIAVAVLGAGGCTTVADQIWDGEVFGASGSIKLQGVSAVQARDLFQEAQAEIARLDSIFSLHNPTSEISRLNQDGGLEQASPEMIEVLQAAQHISKLTNGAFDITVQALWNTAEFLTRAKVTQAGMKQLWDEAYARVDYRFVKIGDKRVSFTKPGVAVTLNGLAQGYVADKVTALFINGGARSGLVNLGEFRAFGAKTWRVGIQDPRNIMDVAEIVSLNNAALATSSALGGYLSAELSHIFAPRTGHAKPQFVSASVGHPSAMIADGLATAFTLLDADSIRGIVQKSNVESVVLMYDRGEIIRI